MSDYNPPPNPFERGTWVENGSNYPIPVTVAGSGGGAVNANVTNNPLNVAVTNFPSTGNYTLYKRFALIHARVQTGDGVPAYYSGTGLPTWQMSRRGLDATGTVRDAWSVGLNTHVGGLPVDPIAFLSFVVKMGTPNDIAPPAPPLNFIYVMEVRNVTFTVSNIEKSFEVYGNYNDDGARPQPSVDPEIRNKGGVKVYWVSYRKLGNVGPAQIGLALNQIIDVPNSVIDIWNTIALDGSNDVRLLWTNDATFINRPVGPIAPGSASAGLSAMSTTQHCTSNMNPFWIRLELDGNGYLYPFQQFLIVHGCKRSATQATAHSVSNPNNYGIFSVIGDVYIAPQSDFF
jgi:hypothetical protein